MSAKIQAVLFDSGRVLNAPQSGHWFMPPGFFKQVDESKFKKISKEKKQIAFDKAGQYICSIPLIATEEDELEHFIKFYEIFSKELPELTLGKENILDLAKDIVYNTEKYTFFHDAERVIPALHKDYKLAVVSDAWPSLMRVFKHAALFPFFSSFVISSVIGAAKPNEKMYRKALEELDVPAQNSVFVDDNLNNCYGAMKLGIHVVLLCRERPRYLMNKVKSIGRGYRVVKSLDAFTEPGFFDKF